MPGPLPTPQEGPEDETVGLVRVLLEARGYRVGVEYESLCRSVDGNIYATRIRADAPNIDDTDMAWYRATWEVYVEVGQTRLSFEEWLLGG